MVSLYATVGSNRLDEAKSFYDALLGQAGIPPTMEHPSGGRVYGLEGGFHFGVLGPYDGQPATAGNGAMVAFGFDSRAEVDAFHAKALALGAPTKACRASGPRRTTSPMPATSTATSCAPTASAEALLHSSGIPSEGKLTP